jgi:putative hydrolase of the HAD superfamily
MPYRAVLFDAGGTLFTVRAEHVARFLHALRATGVAPDEALLRAAVTAADQPTAWSDQVPLGTREQEDVLWLAYCDRVWERLQGVADPELRGRLAADCRWLRWLDVFPDTVRTLQRLYGHARLSILSNNVPSLLEALDTLGLARYFDDVVVSVLVGVSKPAPAIYALALQRLGVVASEALFVDDLEENVRAARDAGLAALLIDREGTIASDGERVSTLDEVADVVLGAQG